jgi:hypothetical protein
MNKKPSWKTKSLKSNNKFISHQLYQILYHQPLTIISTLRPTFSPISINQKHTTPPHHNNPLQTTKLTSHPYNNSTNKSNFSTPFGTNHQITSNLHINNSTLGSTISIMNIILIKQIHLLNHNILIHSNLHHYNQLTPQHQITNNNK